MSESAASLLYITFVYTSVYLRLYTNFVY